MYLYSCKDCNAQCSSHNNFVYCTYCSKKHRGQPYFKCTRCEQEVFKLIKGYCANCLSTLGENTRRENTHGGDTRVENTRVENTRREDTGGKNTRVENLNEFELKNKRKQFVRLNCSKCNGDHADMLADNLKDIKFRDGVDTSAIICDVCQKCPLCKNNMKLNIADICNKHLELCREVLKQRDYESELVYSKYEMRCKFDTLDYSSAKFSYDDIFANLSKKQTFKDSYPLFKFVTNYNLNTDNSVTDYDIVHFYENNLSLIAGDEKWNLISCKVVRRIILDD